MAQINSPESLGPTILTTDPKRNYVPELYQANLVMRPFFAEVNALRAQVPFLEGAFLDEGLSPAQIANNLAGVTPTLKEIEKTFYLAEAIRGTIKLKHLHESVTPFAERPYWIPEEGIDTRKIIVSPTLPLDKVFTNLGTAMHKVATPITALSAYIQSRLLMAEKGKFVDLQETRWIYYRLQGATQVWEKHVAGEFPEEVVSVADINERMNHSIPAFVHGLTKNSPVQVRVRMGHLPDNQRGLNILSNGEKIDELGEGIAQNAARIAIKKGEKYNFVKFSYGYDEQKKVWELKAEDNLTGWDPRMYVPGIGFRFKRGQTYSKAPDAKGIWMYDITTALEQLGMTYELLNNEFGGATQIYRFKVKG